MSESWNEVFPCVCAWACVCECECLCVCARELCARVCVSCVRVRAVERLNEY